MGNPIAGLSILTPNGRFMAHYSEKGLVGLDFPGGTTRPSFGPDVRQHVSAGISDKIRQWHRATESALRNILAGNEPVELPPLDPVGTEFQKKVWRALRKIPLGKTRSYGDIATQIGQPRAVRAVGGACGANPIPVLVPCHRVLAANNKIGGFSGGLDWKRTLLAREGIRL